MADEQVVAGDGGDVESPEEATKRKFREALERKNGNVSGGGSAQGAAKVRGTHGVAGAKRTFRRRAGG
ncbi:DUF5302 domain-containing protein [Nocardia sp. NPDC059177]|uniref:DUF5302 domain-containing protein n=1 Tax=Nocardia sp. NPDC059177 TaxID=3346759 RepID=UPI00368CCA81